MNEPRVVKLETQMETVMDQIEAMSSKIDKLDDRVRSLEKLIWVALGLLQFLAPYISQFIGVAK
jgi:predicted  nucleic acid-binding Zn-ribbon protein